MKQCPTCKRTYPDESLNFCLDDGAVLSSLNDPDATLVNARPRAHPPVTKVLPQGSPVQPTRSSLPWVLVALLVLIVGVGAVVLFMSGKTAERGATLSSPTPSASVAKPTKQMATRPNSQPTTTNPNCVVSYPSGSCWTIIPPNSPCSGLSTQSASVDVASDGKSGRLTVPANASHGVRAEDASGNQFRLQQGDEFQIEASGLASFSADHPCVGPDGLRGWYDPVVDSPFKQNVGALEFSIGSLENNRYFAGTYYRGTANADGMPTFRIVDRLGGYTGHGAFNVTIRKL
jgi:hypothetical protein